MNTTSLVTADDLLALPIGQGKRYELLRGELREMSPGDSRHAKVISNLQGLLQAYVREHDLCMMFGAETGFRLSRDPDTVRVADIAFIAKQRLPQAMATVAFWAGAPTLAIEVLSPDDRTGEVDEKIDAWLEAGCDAVWIVDPALQTVTIYHTQRAVITLTIGQIVEGSELLPGFSCAVDEVFR
jgi:Uma2 family endonuclease